MIPVRYLLIYKVPGKSLFLFILQSIFSQLSASITACFSQYCYSTHIEEISYSDIFQAIMGSLEGPVSLIQDSLISELASSLKSSKLLIPASEGYPEKIKRWADTAEKQAVRSILGHIL